MGQRATPHKRERRANEGSQAHTSTPSNHRAHKACLDETRQSRPRALNQGLTVCRITRWELLFPPPASYMRVASASLDTPSAGTPSCLGTSHLTYHSGANGDLPCRPNRVCAEPVQSRQTWRTLSGLCRKLSDCMVHCRNCVGHCRTCRPVGLSACRPLSASVGGS